MKELIKLIFNNDDVAKNMLEILSMKKGFFSVRLYNLLKIITRNLPYDIGPYFPFQVIQYNRGDTFLITDNSIKTQKRYIVIRPVSWDKETVYIIRSIFDLLHIEYKIILEFKEEYGIGDFTYCKGLHKAIEEAKNTLWGDIGYIIIQYDSAGYAIAKFNKKYEQEVNQILTQTGIPYKLVTE